MDRKYYLHKRKNGIFYVEFIDKINDKKMSARSTYETEVNKAIYKAELWLANGIPTYREKESRSVEEIAEVESILKLIRKLNLNSEDALKIVLTLKKLELINIIAVKNSGLGAISFIKFLEMFWDYDNSEYIRNKLSHGHSLSRRYAMDSLKIVNKYFRPFFGDKKLNCITKDDLNSLSNMMAEKKLATSTINRNMSNCLIALKWAFYEKIINENPCLGLIPFSIKCKKRGTLTSKEANALFVNKDFWIDKRAYVGSLVAATTGIRQGECLALRLSDINEDTINISYNYYYTVGLKSTKNGETRNVPLLPFVREAIFDLLKDNPHNNNNNPFIFYSSKPNTPCCPYVLKKYFRKAVSAVNIEYLEEAKKAGLEKPEISIDLKSRNIVFHSWRHFFCSKVTQIISGEKVSKVSGHLSEKVFKKYSDHIEEKNVREVGVAVEEVFKEIFEIKL